MMTGLSKFSHFKFLVIFLTLFCGVFFFHSGKSSAIVISGANTFFPDTSPFGQGASYTIVQVTGSLVRNANGNLNADTKMKARSTTANIYVPSTMSGQTITITIVNGCDGAGRDNDPSVGSTDFKIYGDAGQSNVVNSKINTNCPAAQNINLTFVATPPTPSTNCGTFCTYAKGQDWFIYHFKANGIAREQNVATRYLNAFSLVSPNPAVQVGVSDWTTDCDNTTYTISCPDVFDPAVPYSAVYSSFYGPAGISNYTQQLQINSSCDVNLGEGDITLYDIDLNDATLKQTNMNITMLKQGSPEVVINKENNQPISSLPYGGLVNWEFGINGQLRPHPNYNASNNRYLKLPGGDPTFEQNATFAANVDYAFKIDGIDSNNAFQMLPHFKHCPSPNKIPGPTCNITQIYNMTKGGTDIYEGDRIGFNVTTTYSNGLELGVNGQNYVVDVYGNYLVSGWTYARTPVVQADIATNTNVTLYGLGDQANDRDNGPYLDTMIAPAASGSPYAFGWGLIVPKTTTNYPCTGPPLVVLPTIPPFDRAPLVSIVGDCSALTITINVDDPDYATNPASPTIDYSVDGVAQPSQNARSFSFARPNPYGNITVSASSYGVNVNPPGGVGTNLSGDTQIFPKCLDTFVLTATAQEPVLDNEDAPTTVTYSGGIALSGSASNVNNVSLAGTTVFFLRGAGPEITIVGVPFTPTINIPPTGLGPKTAAIVGTPAILPGDKICLRLTASPGAGVVDGSGNVVSVTTAFTSDVKCVTIVAKPYLKVFGADILAGGGFVSGTCNSATGAVLAFGKSTGGVYSGSSAQYGIMSLMNIKQTYSASQRTTAPVPAKGLTFSNFSIDPGYTGDPVYGGDFDGTTPSSGGVCIPDYFNATQDGTPTPLGSVNAAIANNDANPNTKQYSATNFGGAGVLRINKGHQLAVYVDGDIYIDRDISYEDTSTQASEIPFFALIVRGNIYIAPNVSRLDGLYVAQPDTDPSTQGQIYTCAKSLGQPYNNAELYSNCSGSQLVINGALIAQQVKFMRTINSLKDSSPLDGLPGPYGTGSKAAEVINFTPELYMAPSPLKDPLNGTITTSTNTYDAIYSLPPIY